jgi:hypothetical protein
LLGKANCKGITKGGERCQAPPLRESDFCFWHDPEYAEEADQARKLGGQRRRREKITEGAYELAELNSIPALRRVLEIALLDALGLENSIARSRALISGVLAGAKLLEVGEMEERMAAVEAALGPRVVSQGKRR